MDLMAIFVEGTTALSSDNELTSYSKWAQLLYAAVGNQSSPFPEGTLPLASDNETRLQQKISIMLALL
jgi:hypothetical protein